MGFEGGKKWGLLGNEIEPETTGFGIYPRRILRSCGWLGRMGYTRASDDVFGQLGSHIYSKHKGWG